MRKSLFFAALFISCFTVVSLPVNSQEQNPIVAISVEEINDKIVYSFNEQRVIPTENVQAHIQRIENLYPNIDSISFDEATKSYSIYFLSTPSEDELKRSFNHFHVFSYTFE